MIHNATQSQHYHNRQQQLRFYSSNNYEQEEEEEEEEELTEQQSVKSKILQVYKRVHPDFFQEHPAQQVRLQNCRNIVIVVVLTLLVLLAN